MQGTSFHSPFSCQIITTQSSPAEKKLSGWFGRQFSYCCQERTVLHLRLGPGLSYSLLHPHPTSLQQSLWVSSTALTPVISVAWNPTSFSKGWEKPWALQSLGLPPLNAQAKHSICKPWGPFHRPPKAVGLQAHQGVPVRPAEVVLHSSVTEADPLVVLCMTWKSRRGRKESWLSYTLLEAFLCYLSCPWPWSLWDMSQLIFPDVLFPYIMFIQLPPHSTCHGHGCTHTRMRIC